MTTIKRQDIENAVIELNAISWKRADDRGEMFESAIEEGCSWAGRTSWACDVGHGAAIMASLGVDCVTSDLEEVHREYRLDGATIGAQVDDGLYIYNRHIS